MNSSFNNIQQFGIVAALQAASALGAGAASAADDQVASADSSAGKSLTQQIFDTMLQAGAKPGYRVAHSKGVVCQDPAVWQSQNSFKLAYPILVRTGRNPVRTGPASRGRPYQRLAV